MFAPFAGSDAGSAKPGEGAEEANPTSSAKPSEDDIDTLKAELQAMQQRLEKLSRN
jgi:hypothetical protein